jgi:hypothetical protein
VYGEIGSSSEVSYPKAQALAREFDEQIYKKITAAFGTPYDVDGNKKVLLLLLDIKDGYARDGDPYTAGYFNANDMYSNSASNKADMLYIDTYPATIGNKQSYRTMAHELQHLISYSVRVIERHSTPLDTWVDEGLSSAAEHIYGGVQSDRIGWLISKDNKSVLYGNNFFVWNGKWEGYGTTAEKQWMASKGYAEDPLTNYSTVYLFFQWLRVHAKNGDKIFKDIIDSPHGDYRAVTEAAASIDSKYDDWAALLGAWYAANLLQNRSGEYGYGDGDELYFNPRYAAAGNPDYPGPQAALAPGEGVYSGLKSGDAFSGGGNIRYGVLAPGSNRQGGTTAFGVSSFTPGNYLVTFNSNKDVTRPVYSNYPDVYTTETGSVGSLPASAVSGNVLSGTPERALTGDSQPKPELYQWDGIRYFRERDKNRDPRP